MVAVAAAAVTVLAASGKTSSIPSFQISKFGYLPVNKFLMEFFMQKEAIAGKCNVVCTSKDDRNRQPSKEELRTANYFFCRTFDVGKCEILEIFPDEIRGLTVERYFNKRNNEKLLRIPKFQTNLKDPAGQSMVSSKLGSAKLMPSPVKIDKSSSRINPVVRESEVPTVCSGARAYASNETLRLQPGFDGFATQSARISHNQEKEKRKTIFLDQPPQPPMAASDTRPSKKMRVPVGVDSTKGENSGKKADVLF
ncbi:uncharacterized protein [Malus domestica]|uniref:uncharacterized protein n=1 Tax=Malus domestica TaxID=3750 RepID=UPI003975A96E